MGKLNTQIQRLLPRLKKIGIEIELSSNVPWVYLDKVNGQRIVERYNANHGYCIAIIPVRTDGQEEGLDLKALFRKLKQIDDYGSEACYFMSQYNKYKDLYYELRYDVNKVIEISKKEEKDD